jgi:type IV fimbrial biogenesis protein FimT
MVGVSLLARRRADGLTSRFFTSIPADDSARLIGHPSAEFPCDGTIIDAGQKLTTDFGISRQRGMSFLEMLVTLAISGTLISLAVPSLAGAIEAARFSASLDELVMALSLARSEAAARRVRVAVSPAADGDWRSGWIVFVDRNDDGRFQAGDEPLVQRFAAPATGTEVTPRFGAGIDGTVLSYTPDGAPRHPGSDGFVLGRLSMRKGEHVRSLCFAAMRVRVVRAATCS